MKDVLVLSFLTSNNKTVHLQVPNPVQPVNPVTVGAAMDAIVSADIFAFPTGRIVKKVEAKLSTADSTVITLA